MRSQRWSIWQIPVGPEDITEPKRLFQNNEEETLKWYRKLRETGEDYSGALIVTDHRGVPKFGCS